MRNQPANSDSCTFEDLVFEKRNKAYGAYDLNQKKSKYLIVAFLISLTGIASAIAVPYMRAFKATGQTLPFITGTTIEIAPVEDDPYIPPPPPPVSPELSRDFGYKAPLVVEEPDETFNLIPVDELRETTVNAPIPDEIEVIREERQSGIEEKPEEIVLFPEERASFMGGDENAFRSWVTQHLTYPQIAIENRIFGMIRVEFCVNAKGEVVDIRLVRKLDPAVDNEVLRVIASSPRWSPAKQGGRPVKQKFTIPVVFRMQ